MLRIQYLQLYISCFNEYCKHTFSDNPCIMKGWGYPCADSACAIAEEDYTTIKRCGELCAEHLTCDVFTITTTANKCFVKDNTHLGLTAKDTATSANMTCYTKYLGNCRCIMYFSRKFVFRGNIIL